jgi:LysM repeat protein
MSKRVLFLTGLILAMPAAAQTTQADVQLANLREDVRGLSERVADLSLKVEQLEAENGRLRDAVKAAGQGGVTPAQLDAAIADLNRAIQSAVSSSQDETLKKVGAQMEKLAKETNAALDSLAKSQASRPAVQASFSDDFPKEGVNYTVQKGDTLAVIAKKMGVKVSDIVNANKIADPSHIQAGQTLFLPGAK